MTDERLQELVLTLAPGPDGDFLVHARSPQGETQAPFRLPSEGSPRPYPACGQGRHVAPAGAGGEPASSFDVRGEGRRLFRALFADAGVRDVYRQTRVAAEGRLRVRVVLDPDLPAVSKLHQTPWEILCDPEGGELLGLTHGVSVVRTLMVPRPPRAFEHPRRLRVLVLLSGAADLDLDGERRELEEVARRSRGVAVSCVPAGSLEELEARLAESAREGRPFHALHLAGHGEVAAGPDGGVLVWEPPGRPPERLPGRRLSTVLRRFPELQLVVLNACTTASLPRESADPFAGVAAALLQGGVPVVVAVQGEIRDRAAVAFTRSFYGALAERESPEDAVAAARWALWQADPTETEWLKPVLFQGPPRQGVPRWLKQAAAVLLVALVVVSALAAVQAHRLATRALEVAVEEAKGYLLDDQPAAAAQVLDQGMARRGWLPSAPRLRAAAHATAAVAAEDLGDLAAAVGNAERAAILEPGRAVHHYNLGALLARAGRPGDAAAPLRRALELDPGFADAANELGCVHLDLGRPEEAWRVLESGAAASPDHALLAKNLGRALLVLGRPEEASEALERSLALLPLGAWPARAEASYWLARAEADRGRGTRACQALGDFTDADPQAVTSFAPDAFRLAAVLGCRALPIDAPGPDDTPDPADAPGGSRAP